MVGIVLARLLTPHDYGLAAMALVFSGLVLAFSDLSLGAGIVQRPQVTERDRSTVFWTSCFVGIGLSGIGILASGALASFFGEPSVRPLFIAISATFFLASLQTTQYAMLQRAMDFRSLNLRLIVANFMAGVTAIALAAAGAGPWALISQSIVMSAVSTFLLWRYSPWRPHFVFSFESLRDIGGFGLNLLGSRMLGYFVRNGDNILIGRYVGASALGAYSIAYNVILTPLSRLNAPLQDTLFPAMSRVQDDLPRLRRLWLRANRALAVIVVPAISGLVIVAPDFVTVVLGKRWHAAIPVVQILAPAGLLQSLTGFGGKLLTALGRARTLLFFAIANAVVTIPAFIVGLKWGIVGVASAYAIVNIPLQLVFLWRTMRAIEVPLRQFGHNLRGVLEASALMALGTLLARWAFVENGLSPQLRLPLLVLLGMGLYALALRWRASDALADLRSLRRDRTEDASSVPSQTS